MSGRILLALLMVAGTALPAAGRDVHRDVARAVLDHVPEWPEAEVELPREVYEAYVRSVLAEPVPPQPPEVVWVERASYTLRIGGEETHLLAAFEVLVLPGEGAKPLALLADTLAWNDVTVNEEAAELRRGEDGWFYFDPATPGRYRVAAKAPLEPRTDSGGYQAAWATPHAAMTLGSVESDAPWDVRFSRAALSILGDRNGTEGTVGLVTSGRLEVTWRRPQPPVRRPARIEYATRVGWTIGEGVHQVRAVLDLRLWGGEAEEVTVNLLPDADRIRIGGPDVREVRTEGPRARVFLRGAIRQRTRLTLSFEVPRAPSGRMMLPAFGVAGGRHSGGTLAIAGGGGAVLLELDSPGLEPMAIHDLPNETRALLAAAPVYAYRLGPGRWEARVDLVAMAEFPVRETLIDSALYTVLLRPDGRVMTKVIYEVRNRARQYMRVELPAGSRLLVARVAEQQKNLVRGAGTAFYVPLEKSVLTTAGLISFPVEIVYVMPAPALARKGRLRLPLPRADLPAAYARCALMVPDGMTVRQWRGVLRHVSAWSSETAELEFEYGRGHLAPGLGKGPPTPKKPGLIEAVDALFGTDVGALNLPADGAERMKQQRRQRQTLQGKNLYRAGVEAYRRGDNPRARGLFQQSIAVNPKSVEADNARKYLVNVEIALGEGEERTATERGLRATAKAVQMHQHASNVNLLARQHALLTQAETAAVAGRETQAEAAYQIAVDLAKQLGQRGEEAHEQEAIVRGARTYLKGQERRRKAEAQKVKKLQAEVGKLKEKIAEDIGRFNGAVEAFVLEDTASRLVHAGGGARLPPRVAGEKDARQVEPGTALAEQTLVWGHGGAGRLGPEGPAIVVLSPGPDAMYDVKGDVAALERQVKRLESFQAGLGARPAPAEPGAPPSGKPLALAPRLELGRKVAARSRLLASHARQAAQLAREGRVAEADELLKGLETDLKVTERAAVAIRAPRPTIATITAAVPADAPEPVRGFFGLAGGVAGDEREHVKANVRDLLNRSGRTMAGYETPDDYAWAASMLDEADRRVDLARVLTPQEAGTLHGQVLALRKKIALHKAEVVAGPTERKGAPAVTRQPRAAEHLWRRAGELRRSNRFAEGVEVMGEIIAADPKDEKARLWRDDLLYLESQARQQAIRRAREKETLAALTDVERAARRPSERVEDETAYLVFGYSDAKTRGALTEFRREFARAVEAVEVEKRRREYVRMSVGDLAEGSESGRKLAEFVASNYDWAMQDVGGVQAGVPVVSVVNGRAVRVPAPGQRVLGVDFYARRDTDADRAVRFTDGNLEVANEAAVRENVEVILGRLRANLGQRVNVGSLNVFVDEGTAQAAGIGWTAGANGVQYALINEGQLMGLMDLEQRTPGASVAARTRRRDFKQDAVVGTNAWIANGDLLMVSRAADASNSLAYRGNDLRVVHDDYLLINNGGYVTAVKSGRMRHWSAEVEPARFPGVPAAIVVPAVGRTVKFEKTLLEPEDTLELVADYTWEGEEK